MSRSESPRSPRQQRRRSRSRSRDGGNDRFVSSRRVDASVAAAGNEDQVDATTSGTTAGSQAAMSGSPNVSALLPSGPIADVLDTSDAIDTQVAMVRESSSHDEPVTLRRARRNRARTSSFAGSLSSQRRRESTGHNTSTVPSTTRTDSQDSSASSSSAHQTGLARDRNYANGAGPSSRQSSLDENGVPVDWVGAPTLIPNLALSSPLLPASQQPNRFSSVLNRTRSSAVIHSDTRSTRGLLPGASGLGSTADSAAASATVTDVRPERRSGASQPNVRRRAGTVANPSSSNISVQTSAASSVHGSDVSSVVVSPTTPPRLAAGLMSPFRRNPLPKDSAATDRATTSISKPYLGPIFTDPELFRSKVLPLRKLATILPLLYAPGTSYTFEVCLYASFNSDVAHVAAVVFLSIFANVLRSLIEVGKTTQKKQHAPTHIMPMPECGWLLLYLSVRCCLFSCANSIAFSQLTRQMC